MAPVPGCIVAYLNAQEAIDSGTWDDWRVEVHKTIPGVIAITSMVATDVVDVANRPYRHEDLIEVADVGSVTEELIQQLRSWPARPFSGSDWHVFKGISADKQPDVNLEERPLGKLVVQVGMSPIDTPEVIADYHEWYRKEHMPILATVEGWRIGNRYQLLASYGDGAEPANSYLAAHQYDQQNGLGGANWRKSIDSLWTKKVLTRLSSPSHRRTWQIVK